MSPHDCISHEHMCCCLFAASILGILKRWCQIKQLWVQMKPITVLVDSHLVHVEINPTPRSCQYVFFHCAQVVWWL